MPGKGRPFTKGDPRAEKGRKNGGRPKKTVSWKEAEDLLRDALPRVLKMDKNTLAQLIQSNPSGAEMVAAKFIHEHVPQTVERFLGKVPDVLTGADGAPVVSLGADIRSNPVDDEMRKMTMDLLKKIVEQTK